MPYLKTETMTSVAKIQMVPVISTKGNNFGVGSTSSPDATGHAASHAELVVALLVLFTVVNNAAVMLLSAMPLLAGLLVWG